MQKRPTGPRRFQEQGGIGSANTVGFSVLLEVEDNEHTAYNWNDPSDSLGLLGNKRFESFRDFH
jgi:hypothetical protein